MLRNRIITALVLAPLVLAGVYYLPLMWFAVVFWLVAAAGAYEWAGLMGLKSVPARISYLLPFGLAAWWLYANPQWFSTVLYAGWVVWGAAIVVVLAYPKGDTLYRNPVLLGIIGFIVFVAAWVALVTIRATEAGALWLFWLLLLVWAADIGAYFSGKSFGRTKLAPAVSPGKTWEGVLGGVALAILACGIYLAVWRGEFSVWLIAVLPLAAISVFGDLFESVLKRSTGIKDSGTLLPGHGGMLDRIDSLLAVLPFFAFAVA